MKNRKIWKRSIVSTMLVLAMTSSLFGCAKKTENKPEEHVSAPDTTDDNYRVFYEIFTGSFSDSDGDGIGDLQGIINRMDYLNDGDVNSDNSLGVQGIWLTPIFASPSYHKYDVKDYYQIDSKFGTEEDLKELVNVCHERNVKVILDLVINHTSRQHAWFDLFKSAHANGDTENKYYNFYSWATKENQRSGSVYNPIPGAAGEYYECNFSTDMPELNYDNEEVREEMLKVAKYYLDLGVDGFRFDAIKYVYYNETAKSAKFWEWYVDELQAYKPDVYTVGECWSGETETLSYIQGVNCFNFQSGQAEGYITNAAKGNNINSFTSYIERYQDAVQKANPDAMMCNFLANHDMDRSAGYLPTNTFRAQMAANLYLLCSGSPFMYYGEEIGMKGSRGSANTDANRRLAMLWGDYDTVKDPEGTNFGYDKQTNGTVKEQMADENSLFHYYCKVLSIRNRNIEIPRGDYKAIKCNSNEVGGFEVTYKDSSILIIHNVGTEATTVDLSTISGLTKEYTKLAEQVGMGEASISGSELTIGPQMSVVIR